MIFILAILLLFIPMFLLELYWHDEKLLHDKETGESKTACFICEVKDLLNK